MKNISQLIAAISVNDLMPRPGESDTKLVEKYKELKEVANLPKLTEHEIITDVILIILQIAGSLALVGILIAGIYMLKSRGEEDDTTKAKEILLNLIIGALIIASAYAIIIGISQFNFFAK